MRSLSEMTWDEAAMLLGRLASRTHSETVPPAVVKQADGPGLTDTLKGYWGQASRAIKNNDSLRYGLLGGLGMGGVGAAAGLLRPQRGRSRLQQMLRNFAVGGLLGGGIGAGAGMLGRNPDFGYPEGLGGGGKTELTNKLRTEQAELQEKERVAGMSPHAWAYHQIRKHVENPGTVAGAGAAALTLQEPVIRYLDKMHNSVGDRQMPPWLRFMDRRPSFTLTPADVNFTAPAVPPFQMVNQKLESDIRKAIPGINWNDAAHQEILGSAHAGETSFHYTPSAKPGSPVGGSWTGAAVRRLPLPLLAGVYTNYLTGDRGQAERNVIGEQLKALHQRAQAAGIELSK